MLRGSPNDPNNVVVSNAVQAPITDIEYGSTSDGGAAVNAETANLLIWVQDLPPSQLAGYNAEILVDQLDQKLIASVVPELATLPLMGVALATFAFVSRRRIRKVELIE